MISNYFNNKLIFGEEYASSTYNSNFLATQISKTVPSLQYIESYGKNKFLGKSYNVDLNGLKICANFMTSSRISATSSDNYALMIPIKGHCITTVENKNYTWGEKTFGYFKPRYEGKSLSVSDKNIVLFDLSPEKFNQQAKIMLGEENKENFYDFEKPNLIPLNYHGISFDTIIKQICKIIDINLNCIENLKKGKFDELIYRTLVIMFLPEKFYNKKEKDNNSISILKLVKELQNEDYFSFMTLSDLESFLNLSTRSLQLFFKKNFQMTPTQFLREQKLRYTKKIIIESDGIMNISKIAAEVGFFNFSQFAKYYKEYHGVSPSQTKKSLKIKTLKIEL